MLRTVGLALSLALAPCAAREPSLRSTLQNGTSIDLAGSNGGWCTETFHRPFWPNAQNNCLWNGGNCCDPSMKCYAKQPGVFAACMPSCEPGRHYWEPVFFWYPWTCAVIPNQHLPTPTPSPVPTPAPTPPQAPAPASPSNAELFTFYMYRAQSNANYPPKNVNTANLPGVMWYLVHEVMIQTPPKFGISRVLRYKVQTKAPQRLIDAHMNFGVRYAYDSQQCTGPGNCAAQYTRWGNFVGCNKLGDFPYPKFDTYFSGGVWYSLPGNGSCPSPPSGGFGCTYSYEPAGEVTLAEIGSAAANAGVFNVFSETASVEVNTQKVNIARSVFKSKYPDQPDELPEPPCDFDFGAFYPDGLTRL